MASMMRAMLYVLQLLVLLEITMAFAQTTIQCTSGDRNIEPLIKNGYWKVELPDGYFIYLESHCTLYMAFCQPLPANGIPGCDASELGPISLCVTNGTEGYSMGAYDDSYNPFWHNIMDATDLSLHAAFNNGSTIDNSQSYLVDFISFIYNCNYYVRFGYSKLCKPAVCGSPQHDTTTLTSPDYWQVSIPEVSCQGFFKGGGCTLYMSFCKPLSGIDHCNNFVNSSICITNGTTDYSLGSYNNLLNPFAVSGNQTLLVAYNGSSQNPGCPSGNVGSIITLTCAKEAKWSESGGKGDASDYLIGLLQNPEDACLVFIELTYSGACKMNQNSPGGESNGDLCGPSLLLIMLLIFSLAIDNLL